jgi:hypothetical protein
MIRTGLLATSLALLLAGCESTSRFGGSDEPSAVAARPVAPEVGIAAPTAPVTAQPLPPAPGTTDPALDPGLDDPLADPTRPAAPGSALTPPATPPPAAPAASAAAPAAAPTSRALAGNWKISDAARGNCGINLTQQSLLDLYRASPSGCQAGSLAKVNAWQQRGQEIVLLEPGGRTAVRLFPKGDGTYEGAATTSGAIIRMSR